MRLDRGDLSGLDRLTSLDVSFNLLEELDDDVLRPLTQLRYLNLAGNRLRTLSADAVPPGVQFLSVGGNRLDGGVAFLAGLAQLRSVDVSANRLRRLDAHLFSPRHARSPVSANFSHNEISSIDRRAFAGVAFNVLDVAGNQLTRLSLCGADGVDVLRADENLIDDVDDEVFRSTRDLHVVNNRLRSLRTSCANNTTSSAELSSLDAATNAVTSTQSTSSSPQLVVLDVSGNPDLGESLEDSRHGCPSLVGLDRLEILRARRVEIRRLPVALIERLTSLRVLDVAQNEIVAMPERGATDDGPLRELNLADNRLTNLGALAAAFSWVRGVDRPSMDRRSAVYVDGNPWRCSCGDVAVCRRLTAVLDSSVTQAVRRPRLPHCASTDDVHRSVVDFCRKLVTSADENQTRLGCSNPEDFTQRVGREETPTLRTLLIIAVVAVVLTASATVAGVGLCRRHAPTRCGRRHTAAGSTRRNGYHMVGETALDFTDVH